MKNTTRRSFLKKTGIALSSVFVVPTIIPASALGKNGHIAPSDRINLAFIGAGNQAENDVSGFLTDERVQITTICDVNKESTGYWDGKVGGRDFIIKKVDDFYSGKYGKNINQLKDIQIFVMY